MSLSRRHYNLFRLVTKEKVKEIIEHINIHEELFKGEVLLLIYR